MKKGKVKYIVIIVILVIYCVLMYLAFGVDETKRRETAATLLIGDSAIWNYSGGSFTNITSQSTISSFDWQEFTVYVDNQLLGNYSVWYDDRWYLFDEGQNAVDYQGNLFAYKADFDMNILPFTVQEISDYRYVEQVLSEYGITTPGYTVDNYYAIDLDQDGVDEEFYAVSNCFMDIDIGFPDEYFSFLFMVDDGVITMLYEETGQNQAVNGTQPIIYSVLDIDNDSNYEMIVMGYKYSVQLPYVMLYKYEDGTLKLEFSNQ